MGKTIKSLRNGHFTDETFELLELKLKQLQQYLAEMEDEESVDLEEQPQKPMDEDFESPEVEALVEEEDPMISMQIEMNNYLKSFKIFN
jgi:hypothetical protein